MNAAGKADFVIGSSKDITERKLAEEKLRSSQEMFSKAFYVGHAGMAITRSGDGIFIDANEPFCRMFDFDRDEVVSQVAEKKGSVA
jgi:PAS domain-containing protein